MPNTNTRSESSSDIPPIGANMSNEKFREIYTKHRGKPNASHLTEHYLARFGAKFLEYLSKNDPSQDDLSQMNTLLKQCPDIIFHRINFPLSAQTAVNTLVLHRMETNAKILDIILNIRYNVKNDKVRELFGHALLRSTVRGDLGVLIKLLYYHPELLKYRGNVVDYSGREFKDVTALELAIWAFDVRHMAPQMLKYVYENRYGKNHCKDLAEELQQQFINVTNFTREGGGVTYTIGCSLLRMSEDPRKILPGKADVERYAELNRMLNRRDGLIQVGDELFYFYNRKFPKELEKITNPIAVRELKQLINKKERYDGTLPIINDYDELEMIQKYIPKSRHIFRENHYDFKLFIQTLKRYSSRDGDGPCTKEEFDAYWCSVIGLEQYYTVPHVAKHYCDTFTPITARNHHTFGYGRTPPAFFQEKVLPGFTSFDNLETRKEGSWFYSGIMSSLGINLGISRAGKKRAQGHKAGAGTMEVLCDAYAIESLCTRRRKDLAELEASLNALVLDSRERQRQMARNESGSSCCVVQ